MMAPVRTRTTSYLPPLAPPKCCHLQHARTHRVVIDVSEADGVREKAPAEVQRHALHVANRPHGTLEA